MEKFIATLQGGHPVAQNDADFMQAGLINAIKGFSSIFANVPERVVILSGINLQQPVTNSFTWSAGYVWRDGEIYAVDAGAVTVAGGQSLLWQTVTTYDPTGLVTYESGTPNNVYEIKKQTLVSGTPPVVVPGNPYTPTGDATLTYAQYLGNALKPAASWINVPNLFPNWTLNATRPLQYRVDSFGYLEFRGQIESSNALVPNNIMFEMPVGLRPPTDFYIVCFEGANAVQCNVQYTASTGRFRVTGPGLTAAMSPNIQFRTPL